MAKKAEPAFAIGVDYGTNSVRALVVDAADGREIATAVFDYPSGEAGISAGPARPAHRTAKPGGLYRGFLPLGRPSGRGWQRAMRAFVRKRVVGIGVDTTGSTPLPVDRRGMPLALSPDFAGNLAAQAWLWKDHTAHAEAARDHRQGQKSPGEVSRASAAAYTAASGTGRKSCTASGRSRRSLRPPTRGWSWPTSCPPS